VNESALRESAELIFPKATVTFGENEMTVAAAGISRARLSGRRLLLETSIAASDPGLKVRFKNVTAATKAAQARAARAALDRLQDAASPDPAPLPSIGDISAPSPVATAISVGVGLGFLLGCAFIRASKRSRRKRKR